MLPSLHFGRLTVIGDLLLDRYISGEVSRISPEAPVPVLLHTDQKAVAGGAANVAVNAAALGCQVHLVGLVGQDAAGDDLLAALGHWKGETAAGGEVRLEGVVRTPEWQTITKTRVLSGRQQIVRIDEERTAPSLSPALQTQLTTHVLESLAYSDALVISDYAKGTLADDILHRIITAARKRGLPVIVDPKRADLSAYRGATLITPNRTELRRATGFTVLQNDEEISQAAAQASAAFGGAVLLTRSEEGMTLWRPSSGTAQVSTPLYHVQARKAEVYDVSGAGDTVLAALAGALAGGSPIEEAMRLAAVAAGIAVGHLGTASVSRRELEEALQEGRISGADMELSPADWVQAQRQVISWRQDGARIVFANGCFDVLHPGHVALIAEAARLGDRLIVGLNSDASVRRLKGPARPVQDEEARARVMGALKGVDMVVLFDEDTPYPLIEALQPDILVKGADYQAREVVGADIVSRRGGHVHLVPLREGHSTTAIVGKLVSERSGLSAGQPDPDDVVQPE
ncbi:D-glycero-beta-D-manno-heptose 1-phosphate adenylyltransferase [Oecophyllibacter saccharovorans]|uniref:D-glycero-beta-D-manno-heptose 1-phosphate adenylyltransferase n=1 Tax=Oecophyllibacter saccharovorans TaxID=2558360 RepID=UPI0011415276|nr:D-glycero-beta-D-manno-heptose 1-phosphate adenylyltransferase [Oecophyllibacter saccharovorans]QDH15287.1 D-glycero-beta-D-manno-heptose 1-phosphate adenylyltransferase [Oecophyllibacter saccharovorans]